ncbi:MAG TPA: methyltransferase domain-containing protein [Actinomycetota bacterium]|nr:methyltransferase domain-containing protein [Actinomycetota bacterium]
MAETTETFQLPLEAAEAYEARFVPALFTPWAERLVDALNLPAGARVLDVACGTGAVARLAADRVGDSGAVIGLDLNEAMLTVARRLRNDVDYRQGDASRLPFPDEAFDVVTCQAGLMFFPDPEGALRELARVVTASGTVGIQVWDRRADQPAYDPFNEVVERHAGPDAVSLVNVYFVHGDRSKLEAMLRSAGLAVDEIRTGSTTMRFASVDELVAIEVQGTPLGALLSEDVVRAIVDDASVALRGFATDDGALDVPMRGHIVIARAAA